jgi:esterase/lipase superfamily enzyme
MTWLGDLSVRVLSVGGPVAAAIRSDPTDWLQGRRRFVLLIHGYNNSEDDARTSYSRVFLRTLSDVAYFFWPGDARGGRLASAASYPFQIRSARDSAQRLFTYLSGLFGPAGTPATIDLVAHSLGCRLVAELLHEFLGGTPGAGPRLGTVVLMAAAVPVDLLEAGQPLCRAMRRAQRAAMFHSLADSVLRDYFPPGQDAAYRFGIEVASYRRAVGRYGEPTSLTSFRFQQTLGHSDYWPSRDVARQVAGLLGIAGPRTTPTRPAGSSRSILTAPPPQSRSLPSRSLLSRPLPSR